MGSMDERIRELAGDGDDEGIFASGDSATALRLMAVIIGEPVAIFLRDNGNYAGRWNRYGVTTTLEFEGIHRIQGVLLGTASLPSHS